MIGIFKKRSPFLFLLLILYAVAVKWVFFSVPQPVSGPAPGGVLFKPLWYWLTEGGNHSFRLRALGLFFNLVQAFQLNALINRHKMMGAANYLPALSYLTLSAVIPEWNDFSPWSLVICLVLWIFHGQFSLYQSPQSRGIVYNRCLLWGLVPLIEPAAYPFLLWGVIGIWVMRPFRWAEAWVMLIGLLTPFYFLLIWRYWNGLPDWYRVFPVLSFQLPVIGDPRTFFTGVGLLLIPTLVGMMQVQSNLRKMLIPVRKGWTHWTIWLLLALAVPLFLTGPFEAGSTALLVPVAAFQACFFFYASLRIVPLFFFWLQLIAVLWIQYGDRFS